MPDEINDPRNAWIDKQRASADEALQKSENERRRNLEVRASFYDKLSALSAGSIALAVSVGIALLGKSESPISSMHSDLSWLSVIALLLWISLICAIGHNYLIIKIARLEADEATEWSKYLALTSAWTSAHTSGSPEARDMLEKVLSDSVPKELTQAPRT